MLKKAPTAPKVAQKIREINANVHALAVAQAIQVGKRYAVMHKKLLLVTTFAFCSFANIKSTSVADALKPAAIEYITEKVDSLRGQRQNRHTRKKQNCGKRSSHVLLQKR